MKVNMNVRSMNLAGRIALGPRAARAAAAGRDRRGQTFAIPTGIMELVPAHGFARPHEIRPGAFGLAIAKILQSVVHGHAAGNEPEHRQVHQPAAFGIDRQPAKLFGQIARAEPIFEQLGESTAEIYGTHIGRQLPIRQRAEED